MSTEPKAGSEKYADSACGGDTSPLDSPEMAGIEAAVMAGAAASVTVTTAAAEALLCTLVATTYTGYVAPRYAPVTLSVEPTIVALPYVAFCTV